LNYQYCEQNEVGVWQSCDSTSSPYVVLDIEILTWRTHQIRYHLSTHGLPIVWDYVYGTESESSMQLSARRLVFLDISGEHIDISLD
jgi:23S rRNA-/tRNA-specific pseudouridylate synthase